MLTEAEIALVKLLETVDQAAPHQSQALDDSDCVMQQASRQPPEDPTEGQQEKFTLFSDHNGSLLRRQPGAEDPTALRQYDCSGFCTSAAHGNIPDDHTEAMSHSSISSMSSNDSGSRQQLQQQQLQQQQQQQQQQQTGPNIVADDQQIVFTAVTGRKCECHATGSGGVLSDNSGIAMSSEDTTSAHRSKTAACVDALSQGGQMMRTDPLQSQVTDSA